MLHELKKYLPKQLSRSYIPETDAGKAYDIWSENYDHQPGNLMLDLDEQVFGTLLKNINLYNKNVGDIGCGTGRHWAKIIQQYPSRLSGFDVSAGMLQRLNEKFPEADTHLIKNNLLPNIPTNSFDVLVSTLTVAHIKNLEETLLAWCRIVKDNGDILITDFHPDALAVGGQRTFKHSGRHIAVRNFVHKLEYIKAVFTLKNWEVVHEQEIMVDEKLKHYYEQQHAMHVYDKFKGLPIIYGIHLRQQ